MKNAGVRDPEGSAGLLRAMEPRSVLERTIGGAEISKPLGFLAFGGSEGHFVLDPEERFSGSRESGSWRLDSRKRLLCSKGRGELGDSDGDREEDGEAEETLAGLGSMMDDIFAETEDAKKAEAAAASEVDGKDTMGLMTCLSVLFVTNRITVRTSSRGVVPSSFSSTFSVLIGFRESGWCCRELMVKDEYSPEWIYSLRLVLFRAEKACLCSLPSKDILQLLSCSKRLSLLISTAWGSIFKISGKDTNLYTNFCPITFLMMFCIKHQKRGFKKLCFGKVKI